jgi:MFS family permease
MKKAQLTGGQTVSAVLAGFFGNLFFTLGWTLLGFALFGSALFALAGASLNRVVGAYVEAEQLEQILTRTGGVLGVVAIIVGAGAVVLIAIGIVLSGVILRAGKARKPWAVTWASIGISALLSLPLFLLYAALALRRDSDAGFVLVSFLGTSIVGILVWLWMTWARRGPAVTDPTVPAVDPAPEAPAVTSAEAPPAVEAPAAVAKAPAAKTPAAKAPAAKAPAAKAPTAKTPAAKTPAAKAPAAKTAATKAPAKVPAAKPAAKPSTDA